MSQDPVDDVLILPFVIEKEQIDSLLEALKDSLEV